MNMMVNMMMMIYSCAIRRGGHCRLLIMRTDPLGVLFLSLAVVLLASGLEAVNGQNFEIKHNFARRGRDSETDFVDQDGNMPFMVSRHRHRHHHGHSSSPTDHSHSHHPHSDEGTDEDTVGFGPGSFEESVNDFGRGHGHAGGRRRRGHHGGGGGGRRRGHSNLWSKSSDTTNEYDHDDDDDRRSESQNEGDDDGNFWSGSSSTSGDGPSLGPVGPVGTNRFGPDEDDDSKMGPSPDWDKVDLDGNFESDYSNPISSSRRHGGDEDADGNHHVDHNEWSSSDHGPGGAFSFRVDNDHGSGHEAEEDRLDRRQDNDEKEDSGDGEYDPDVDADEDNEADENWGTSAAASAAAASDESISDDVASPLSLSELIGIPIERQKSLFDSKDFESISKHRQAKKQGRSMSTIADDGGRGPEPMKSSKRRTRWARGLTQASSAKKALHSTLPTSDHPDPEGFAREHYGKYSDFLGDHFGDLWKEDKKKSRKKRMSAKSTQKRRIKATKPPEEEEDEEEEEEEEKKEEKKSGHFGNDHQDFREIVDRKIDGIARRKWGDETASASTEEESKPKNSNPTGRGLIEYIHDLRPDADSRRSRLKQGSGVGSSGGGGKRIYEREKWEIEPENAGKKYSRERVIYKATRNPSKAESGRKGSDYSVKWDRAGGERDGHEYSYRKKSTPENKKQQKMKRKSQKLEKTKKSYDEDEDDLEEDDDEAAAEVAFSRKKKTQKRTRSREDGHGRTAYKSSTRHKPHVKRHRKDRESGQDRNHKKNFSSSRSELASLIPDIEGTGPWAQSLGHRDDDEEDNDEEEEDRKGRRGKKVKKAASQAASGHGGGRGWRSRPRLNSNRLVSSLEREIEKDFIRGSASGIMSPPPTQ